MSESKVKARFDRIAWIYDLMESPMEWMSVSDWRRELIGAVSGKVLEVGVGTGKNLPYYPPGTELAGVDISPKMLNRAREKAEALGMKVNLSVMDVEEMTFPDESFDYVVSTFVFCSVPDPLRGLQEVRRVLRKQGAALFLEHVRSENRILGYIMDLLNPVVRSLIGPNINRRTVENVKKSGLEIIFVEDMGSSKIMKKIVARRHQI